MFRAQEYTEIFTYRVSVLTHSLQIIYPQVLIYGKSYQGKSLMAIPPIEFPNFYSDNDTAAEREH